MTEPLVSILLLSHDYERYIGEAIRSVLAQTSPHWELIVSDDASTDRSLEVVRAFSDPRIRVLESPTNEGPAASYNRAYEACRGRYIGSLDADDYLAPDKLARQIAFFESHPEIDILGTFVTEVDDSGRIVGAALAAWHNQERDLDHVESWLMRNHLCHSSVLLRRSIHERLGVLDPHLRAVSDYDLWLRGVARGARFAVLAEPLTFSRQHGSNLWRRMPRAERFLELAYVYAAHLRPHLEALGKEDLLASCVSFLVDDFLAEATDQERAAARRQLARPRSEWRDFTAFAADCAAALPSRLQRDADGEPLALAAGQQTGLA